MKEKVIVIGIMINCFFIGAGLTLIVLSPEPKEYEPTAIQILATLQDVRAELDSLKWELQKDFEKAGEVRAILDDCIKMWRYEVSNYTDAFDEDIGQ